MNITDASIPNDGNAVATINPESCAGPSSQHIHPQSSNPIDPTLRNSGGGAWQTVGFGRLNHGFPRTQTTRQVDSQSSTIGSQPPGTPKPNVGESSVVPESERQQATVGNEPTFPRFPGETPRAYAAFMTFFQLGHGRSLHFVSEKLGLGIDSVKKWSSRFDWNERIQSFNTGLLQQQAQVETAVHKKIAEDLAMRTAEYREREWESSQKLWQIVECCIANFGDAELEKVRLGDIARTLQIASNVSRSALQIAMPKDDQPQRSPTQDLMLEALKKMKPQFEAFEKERAAKLATTATNPGGH